MKRRVVSCPVCMQPKDGTLICRSCRRSYERDAQQDDTQYAIICWAARRARRFERSAAWRRIEEGE